ncbi:MAG: hypothetical protein M1825_003248 [Sarcosagium campestre]|nr:MAG: hypothetical protein M1825_003248 [Sarcosagium campestre]
MAATPSRRCATKEFIPSSRSTIQEDDCPQLSSSAATSPPTPATDAAFATKLRKRPSVTPRTFRRFFQPRSLPSADHPISAARLALKDITKSGNNGGPRPMGPFEDIDYNRDENSAPFTPTKKRKALSSDPLWDINPKSKRLQDSSDHLGSSPLAVPFAVAEDLDENEDASARENIMKPPIKRLGKACVSVGLLQRSLAGSRCSAPLLNPSSWQVDTADFYSRPSDTYLCTNVETSSRVPPFCSTSCNTNSLVAVGDEEGGVRLLESAKGAKTSFADAFLTFKPHNNAILDLSFSSDDLLLATASGDQTASIVDMPTRRTLATLAGHVSSVKQVCFQPGQGSNSVIVTSSRDGIVHVWDTRCRAARVSTRDVRTSLDAESGPRIRPDRDLMTRHQAVNSIFEAHAMSKRAAAGSATPSKPALAADTPSKGEVPSRRGDVSVTSVAFLPPGREHLLMTASEANACIRVWDLRKAYTHRRGLPVPLTVTRQPRRHDGYRQFGVNSLSLSGDGARVYSLCRDNTIYAYSTDHLVLGPAPEFNSPPGRPRSFNVSGKDGLGPIYGFRHPQLHATTFYVKSSLRPATDGKSEMLAVGSSDGCAVLFPTDERLLKAQRPLSSTHDTRISSSSFSSSVSSSLSSATSTLRTSPRTRRSGIAPKSGSSVCSGGVARNTQDDGIPIYGGGTALVRGHTKEVAGVSWTTEGELVTVGDDFLVRCWREGTDAKDLRTGGVGEGRQWGCGWADVEDDKDDDSDEDD